MRAADSGASSARRISARPIISARRGSGRTLPSACGTPAVMRAVISVAAFPMSIIDNVLFGARYHGLVDDPLDWRTPFARCVDALRPAWVNSSASRRVASKNASSPTSAAPASRWGLIRCAFAARK